MSLPLLGYDVFHFAGIPGHNLPVGKEGEKDSAGNLGVHQYLGGVFWRLSTAMYSKERERFPKELFLPGFPTRDNLQTGTEDSSPPSHHSELRPAGGVLPPQLNPRAVTGCPQSRKCLQTAAQCAILQNRGYAYPEKTTKGDHYDETEKRYKRTGSEHKAQLSL